MVNFGAPQPPSFFYILFNRLLYRSGISSRMLATMERQSHLLSVLLSICAGVIPPPKIFARLSISFTLGLPLPLLPSTLPVTQTFSSCWSLIRCPRHRNCLCLIIFMISLLVPARCNTSSFLTLSVHEIFSILLKKPHLCRLDFHHIFVDGPSFVTIQHR